ncbi:uncharacterized protein FOMMEDRAFT_153925 [Fomitiporia mediterranea MF3/22]|uniref:uncharacterized protein n=1 Tax=Fomitiporia mediterranea (strain MF3/22) TaxID=694068 RepID=UPI0004408A29|nr:uncharacterized protein FOMMEDRAFT_153925 [Fomitiporia mediterranea MF3/22]EJD04803.1 hypothetical protein FOMMEDRAFT_153925 [Fomitiporia mediterranea MF3/22]
MSQISYVPNPGKNTAGLNHTMRDIQQDIVMPKYSNQYSISHIDFHEAANPLPALYSNLDAQGADHILNDTQFSQRSFLGYDTKRNFSNTSEEDPYRPQTFYQSHLHLPYSPDSAQPCPRISRQNSSSTPPDYQTPAGSAVPARGYSISQQEQNRRGLTSFQVSPSLHPSFACFGGAQNIPWYPLPGIFADQINSEATRCARFPAQSMSPQFICSELSEERPPQRRRIAWSNSIICSSSDAGSTSDTSHTTVSSTQRQTTHVRKSRNAKKGRGKRTHTEITGNSSSAFTTFSVSLTPAEHEPAGATYMSTVDFRSDSDCQAFEHGPTDLPPRPYIGGPDSTSPWKPRKNLGTIPGSALDYVRPYSISSLLSISAINSCGLIDVVALTLCTAASSSKIYELH